MCPPRGRSPAGRARPARRRRPETRPDANCSLTSSDRDTGRRCHRPGLRRRPSGHMSPHTPAVPPSARKGRSPRREVKAWRRSPPLERLVRSVVAFRSKDDELAVMTNAEMTARVLRIGRCSVGRTLSPRERRRLRRLAQSARPCEITRVLYQWRGTLTDRLVRTVQRREDIRDMIWA